MIKYFKNDEPTNADQDAFALSHSGLAITMQSPQALDPAPTEGPRFALVSTHHEASELQVEGWKVKWVLNASDFGFEDDRA